MANSDENVAIARRPHMRPLAEYGPVHDALYLLCCRVYEDGAHGVHRVRPQCVSCPPSEIMRIEGEQQMMCIDIEQS